MKKILTKAIVCLTLIVSSPMFAADFVDNFDFFNQENWTKQLSGIRMAEEPFPPGITIKDGICFFNEPLQGLRFTSRQKFLYGTFETRVKIEPRGLQYIGFMSRQPWGANAAYCMSLKDGSGWRLGLSNNTPRQGVGIEINQGADVGISINVPENDWCTIKIVWQKDKIEFYANGELKGTVTDKSLIPQSPTPLLIDQVVKCPMEVDYIKVIGTTIFTKDGGDAPKLPAKAETKVLQSKNWKVVIDKSSGMVRQVYNLQPTPVVWTPEDTAGIDFYIRKFPDGKPVRFVKSEQPQHLKENVFKCYMTPTETQYKDTIKADYTVELKGDELVVSCVFTAIKDINYPVEIGLGLPFKSGDWDRQIFAHCPWLAISPRQNRQIRFPFLVSPNDVTVASFVGSWIFYPMGLLDGKDRMVFWGNMDIGKRTVLSPTNYGSVPATTLAPKSWPKSTTKTLEFTLKSFPKPQQGLPDILRWYLSNCCSSDPLTSDLFPIRSWTPRTFAKGGGAGMPGVSSTHINTDKGTRKRFDRATELFLKYNIPNICLGTYHKIDGSYPTSGQWYSTQYFWISAEKWRDEVQRLKKVGLRPLLYVNQFITPELLKDGGVPDKRWVLYGTDGILKAFETYTVGQHGFTKEIAEKIGTNKVTWADADYGNDDFRKWYTEQVKAVIDYYQPSGISFDYGWSVMGPYMGWSPANSRTSQARGRLRVQADIRNYIKQNYPDMEIMINCIPGSPSQFFADAMVLESTHVMSDIDFMAGKALGSAMTSMDYFHDHDRTRWTKIMMNDLARGCSFGSPVWIVMSPPESEYFATWTTFLEFSGRATMLPHIPRHDAVTAVSGSKDFVGTVWTDGKKVMAAVYDRRTEGEASNSTFSLMLPQGICKDTKWKLSRLNNMNVEIPESGWSVKEQGKDKLLITGLIAAGEMVLVENVK